MIMLFANTALVAVLLVVVGSMPKQAMKDGDTSLLFIASGVLLLVSFFGTMKWIDLFAECELNLPRSQQCELIAVPAKPLQESVDNVEAR